MLRDIAVAIGSADRPFRASDGNARARLIRRRIDPMKSSEMPRLRKTIGVARDVDSL
jgi:hypothetical protein